MKSRKLVFIGDSLTECFDWQGRFSEYDVMNLGIAGETVEGLLIRIDRIGSSIKNISSKGTAPLRKRDCPLIIFIMTGINNIAMEDSDILKSYKKIVSELSSKFKDAVIVAQSILPVNLYWIDNDAIKEINERLKETANEFNAEYLDIFSLFIDSKGTPNSEYLLDDGVHLSDAGYDVWAKAVEGFLKGA